MKKGATEFQEFPTTPESLPTTDYQVANKIYVDASLAGTTYTDSHTVTTAQDGWTLYMNAASKAFTLPSVGSDNDGMEITLVQLVSGLSVTPADSDTIMNSGAGDGIETMNIGPASVTLKYLHSETKWVGIGMSGSWMLSGLVLDLHFDTAYTAGATTTFVSDSSQRHNFVTLGTAIQAGDAGKFGPGAVYFNGSAGFIRSLDSADYDFMADKDADIMIECQVKPANATGTTDTIYSQYEDANNGHQCYRDTAGKFNFLNKIAGTIKVTMQTTSAYADTNWHHIVLFRKGSTGRWGLYVDGAQDATDLMEVGDEDTYAGNFFMGQKGDSTNWFGGYVDEVRAIYGNPYGLNPDTGNTDSFTAPTAKQISVFNATI